MFCAFCREFPNRKNVQYSLRIGTNNFQTDNLNLKHIRPVKDILYIRHKSCFGSHVQVNKYYSCIYLSAVSYINLQTQIAYIQKN